MSAELNDYALSVNPASGQLIARYRYDDDARLEQILALADAGFRRWAATPLAERLAAFRRLGAILRRDNHKLAELATLEMGKPVLQARAEVEKCAVLCDWYADNGQGMLDDRATAIGPNAYVSCLPLGIVLGVMPWNFPYWQILRGAIPILLGGNGYLLKHAPNVMGCAYLTEAAMAEAGLPAGAFSVANIGNAQVSAVIVDRRIAAVTVTGSVRAGSAIAAQAGAALKKTVLELGGADPFIVLADADIDAAVAGAVTGRFQNTGQICIAAKRIILEKPIAARFTEAFVDKVKALAMGDPSDEANYIGPMARPDLRDELARQVAQTREQGARCLLGGAAVDGPGSFHQPTVLAGVQPGMTAFEQETFGPVAALVEADDADHAVALANRSEYGLSGSLWTQDRERARRLARTIDSGGVYVNSFSVSDPRVPIGGVKKSGYGRELGEYGVLEFMNLQTVWIDRR